MFVHDSSLETGSSMEALFQKLKTDEGKNVAE